MSEWLLIAWGAAECNYAVIPNCMRKHAIDINLAKLTVHYNKYEYVWDGQVYGIQVYSAAKLLSLTIKLTVH